MDNLSSHKRANVRDLIEAADARLLFLPPYSSDFSPIGKALSRLKACSAKLASASCPGFGPSSATDRSVPAAGMRQLLQLLWI